MGQHELLFLTDFSSAYHHYIPADHDYSASDNDHDVASHHNRWGDNDHGASKCLAHGALDDDDDHHPGIDHNDRRVRNNNWFFDVNDHRFEPKRSATCG